MTSAKKKDRPAEPPGPSPVAERIRQYIAERKKGEPTYSARKLSASAGLNASQLSNILARLDARGDVAWELLAALAEAMGWTLDRLLSGAEPDRLCDAPGWASAVEEALRIHPHLDPDVIATVGQLRGRHPERVDAHLVIALVLGWTRR